MKLILFFYNLFFPLVLLILLPGVIFRMLRRGNYAHKFGQRFGLYSKQTKAIIRRDRGNWIWIHAVSVGEVQIALKFIRALQRATNTPVLLSTTTSTGFDLAMKNRGKLVEVIYHPVDFFLTASRTVALVRPKALVLVEAEVWPNLTTQVRKMGSPVILINARLSPRSETRYRFFRPFVAPLFRSLSKIGLQDAGDAARYLSIGATAEQMVVTGSIKFDLEEDGAVDTFEVRRHLERLEVSPATPILLGASTHPGEEKILGRILKNLRKEFPELFLVLVPRHFEKASKAVSELESLGLQVVRMSEKSKGRPDVLVVDSTGHLRQWMEPASLVFVGKSLTAQGGQNPAEAVAAGKPVLFGPNMQNFQALVELLLAEDGARQVTDEDALEQACRHLLSTPEAATALTERARSALQTHQGATSRTLVCLNSLINQLPE